MKNSPGIYSIRNTVSGRIYVGSSSRVSLRLSQHRWALKRGDHVNPLLQASWIKHGDQAFEFKTLEECDHSMLLDREQFWIRELQADGNEGYNLVQPIRSLLTPNIRASAERRARWDGLDEEGRKKKASQFQATSLKEGNRQRMKERWADPDYRAARLKGLDAGRAITNARKDPKILANLAAGRAKAIERSKNDPERRRQQREIVAAQRMDPAFRAKMIENLNIGRDKLNLRKKADAAARRASNDIV